MTELHKKCSILPKQITSNNLLARMARYKFMYLILAPALILVIIFCYLPMAGIIIAFQDYDIIGGITRSKFVGFKNFVEIFTYPKFLNAMKNTLIYSSVGLFFGTPFPILLAILFNELKLRHFKKVVQTISYLPYFISWISVIGMFYAFFATDGTFNDIFAKIFGDSYQRVNILMDSKYFLGIIFWSNLWKTLGWSSILYLAAITVIEPTLYEAAMIDGCNRFKQTLYITLPGMFPTIAIVFIMNTANLVTSNFEQVFGFQNLYIQSQTETINTLVYRQGIENGQYSLSTAFGMAQGLVSFVLVFVSNKIVKKYTGVGIW